MRKREQEMIRKLEQEKNQLLSIARDHIRLERFIAGINEYCKKYGYQFCGLYRVSPPDETGTVLHMGYILINPNDVNKKFSYDYSIYGYLSTTDNFNSPDYVAHLTQRYSDIVPGKNTIYISENYVSSSGMQGKGIGAAGMDIIKTFARQLHCTEIIGKKVPKNKSVEAMEELTSFYRKNGFDQDDVSPMIKFDLRKKHYPWDQYENWENIRNDPYHEYILKGEQKMAILCARLLSERRFDDLARVVSDPSDKAVREKYFREFCL